MSWGVVIMIVLAIVDDKQNLFKFITNTVSAEGLASPDALTTACIVMTKMIAIETVSLEGTFCDTVQVPSRGGDMELI